MRLTLRCTRCGREYQAAPGRYLCDTCPTETVHGIPVRHGLLEVVTDLPALRGRVSRSSLGRGSPGLWRYRSFLPEVEDRDIVTLGEGGTPLLAAPRLGRVIGLPRLHLKLELLNPTGAFKDRETAVAVSVGRALGVRIVTCASTGSIAVSAAAYAARAGLGAIVFAPATLSPEKAVAIAISGARLVLVGASYERTLALEARAIEKWRWYDLSEAANPYRIEGDKTTAFEICEQLAWQVPDWLAVPTGGGGHLSGLWKGFCELADLGLIDRRPKLASIGTDAGAPLAAAFEAGRDQVTPVDVKPTVAGALLSGYADYGAVALRAIRESGGLALAVSDAEILTAQKDLAASEGVFAEPSGAAGVAGLARLVRQGLVRDSETAVCLITGAGARETRAVESLLPRPEVIPDTLEALEAGLAARPGSSDFPLCGGGRDS